MHYDGNIIRPPSEADSILLQVTTGCSHNRCAFCGAYHEKRFRFKGMEQVAADIDYAAKYYSGNRRLFLCDGDALILPQDKLVEILRLIREKLPAVGRVGLYANAKSVIRKADDELCELKQLGLATAYMGLESGDDQTLKYVNKGVSSAEQIEQGSRIRAAGIKLSLTALLGIAPQGISEQHARATGKALSAIDPEFVGVLSVMLIPGTPMHAMHQQGEHYLPNAHEMLKELRWVLEETVMQRGMFMSNHASNYLPLRLRMPKDKQLGLDLLGEAINGRRKLRQEWMRAL